MDTNLSFTYQSKVAAPAHRSYPAAGAEDPASNMATQHHGDLEAGTADSFRHDEIHYEVDENSSLLTGEGRGDADETTDEEHTKTIGGKKKTKTYPAAAGRESCTSSTPQTSSKRFWTIAIIAGVSLLVIGLGLGIGVPLGLRYQHHLREQAEAEQQHPVGGSHPGGNGNGNGTNVSTPGGNNQNQLLVSRPELKQLNDFVQQNMAAIGSDPVVVSSGLTLARPVAEKACANVPVDGKCFCPVSGAQLEVEEVQKPGGTAGAPRQQRQQLLLQNKMKQDHQLVQKKFLSTWSTQDEVAAQEQQAAASNGDDEGDAAPNDEIHVMPVMLSNTALKQFSELWNDQNGGSSVFSQMNPGGNDQQVGGLQGKPGFPAAFMCKDARNISTSSTKTSGTARVEVDVLCEYPVLAVVKDAHTGENTSVSYNFEPAYYADETAGRFFLLPDGKKAFRNTQLQQLVNAFRALHNQPEVPAVAVLQGGNNNAGAPGTRPPPAVVGTSTGTTAPPVLLRTNSTGNTNQGNAATVNPVTVTTPGVPSATVLPSASSSSAAPPALGRGGAAPSTATPVG
ncbi:unnamed protein product, partial [Amoebophrya sp. A120]|eukprot:GSA120T00008882001.1